MTDTPLGAELRALIAEDGPISVASFMTLALGHPVYGYYRTRDPLGAAGDFVTSPEISQVFGELLGLWAAATWEAMGRPANVALVELGPGRGTLMADALRAAGVLPAFRDALSVHLVETSPVLRAAQQDRLGGCGRPLAWHDAIDTLPDGPCVVLANEFFDALPIRQFVRGDKGWHERLVGCDAQGALTFGMAGEAEPGLRQDGALGTVIEINDAAQAIVGDLARRLARDGGAALIVDYGRAGGVGDTLQAMAGHRAVAPLARPGEADLTAHVDFAALARAARLGGAVAWGPLRQSEFLGRLGLAARVARLAGAATPERAAALRGSAERLVAPDIAPGDGRGMGHLFKVLAIASPDLAPPGFSADETA